MEPQDAQQIQSAVATEDNKVAQPAATPQEQTVQQTKVTADTKPADKVESTPTQQPKIEEFNVKPEDYGNFGLDEKTKIDDSLSGQLKSFAIEHKIKVEDMNKFVKNYVDFANNKLAEYNKQQSEDYNNEVKGWEEANQKKYGANTNVVYSNINEFLNSSEKGKALNKFLTDNKITKNSVIVDFLNEVSKDYKEANLVNSNLSGIVQKSAEDILYPDN